MPLENRLTPSGSPVDIDIRAIGLNTSTVVRIDYKAQGVSSFDVGIFRSSDAVFDNMDLPVTGAKITPGPGSNLQTATVKLAAELSLDPAHKFVIVVADPNSQIAETNENNNAANFRKLALGVTVHGLELTGTLPAWVGDAAAALEARGFDRAFVFNWIATSQLPIPGLSTLAATNLANRIRLEADAIATLPNDVVDLQVIGHSRGNVVNGLALAQIQMNPGNELRNGYFTMTMLDPHAARNQGTLAAGLAELTNGTGTSTIGGFSFNPANPVSQVIAAGTIVFQALVNDPPIFVPANVDRSEVFFQRLPWFSAIPDGQILGYNLWGRLNDIVNLTGRPLDFVFEFTVDPLNPFGPGHYGLPPLYVDNVLLMP